ncbi:MAG: nuclear transport factor 2 family protein [Gemmatimonadaceae bacterium]|nr:nuclear transport factor 2 family protein [Gemmatimonadaceae bacterium]
MTGVFRRSTFRLVLLAATVAVAVAACGPGAVPGAGDARVTGEATVGAAPAAIRADAPPATDPAADEAAIRAVLDRWYVAMQGADSAGTLAPLTRDFLLLEDTLPLTGPQLAARLREGAGTRWTASFSDFRTRLNGNVAWTTLRNHEESTGGDGKRCQADFLETIVFVREGQRWLIDRYHAAALHRWSCS